MAKPVRLTLTLLQAECLLQLAQESNPETFESDGDGNAEQRSAAGEQAMDKLISAIAKAEGR
jgi:hypothetical protein